MKKDPAKQEEIVHEHDAFIKMMIGLKDSALAKQKMLTTVLLVVVFGLIALAVVSAVYEQRADDKLNVADLAETVEEMEDAVALCPDDVGLNLRLAQAYSERTTKKGGDEQRIYELLQQALAAADTEMEKAISSLALGKAEMDLKTYEDALGHFDGAAAAPHMQMLTADEAKCYAGLCLEQLGRPKEALERYEKVGASSEGRQSAGPWRAFAEFRKSELRRQSRD